MVAQDVHKIAKALSKEEYTRLFYLLKDDLDFKPIKNKNNSQLSTLDEAIDYLLKNHCK